MVLTLIEAEAEGALANLARDHELAYSLGRTGDGAALTDLRAEGTLGIGELHQSGVKAGPQVKLTPQLGGVGNAGPNRKQITDPGKAGQQGGC